VADLVGSPVEDAAGRLVGHVVELELGDGWEVTAVLVGARGWLSRWNVARFFPRLVRGQPERVPWDQVAAFEALRLRLKE
jgi:hypothetical protein